MGLLNPQELVESALKTAGIDQLITMYYVDNSKGQMIEPVEQELLAAVAE